MRKQKSTSRQVRAIKTKNKIYESAIELMRQHGYEEVKIEDICERANVSVGSYYNYFKSKNDILIEAFKETDSYFENYVIHNLRGNNSLDKIVEYFYYYACHMEKGGVDIVKEIYSSASAFFLNEDRFVNISLEGIVLEGQSKGEICKNITAKEISRYLLITARGITYDWCLHCGEYDLKDFIEGYFRHFVSIFKNIHGTEYL